MPVSGDEHLDTLRRRVDDLEAELRTLVRTALTGLRAELATEVRTRRVTVVDEYGRPWVLIDACEDHGQVVVAHPDRDLVAGLAVQIESEPGGAHLYAHAPHDTYDLDAWETR